MRRRSVQHGMQGAFVFVLLGLFALMSTLLVLFGAQMYRNTVKLTEENNTARVVSSYLRSMVRAQDAAGAVQLETYDGVQTIALHEEISGAPYVTWLYTWEDMLYEQFTGADRPFVPEHGTPITAAKDLQAALEDGQLQVMLTDGSGGPVTVNIALWGGSAED